MPGVPRMQGVMNPLPPPDGVATMWVTTGGAHGQVLSADDIFSDWFGYKASELAGSTLEGLVMEHKQLLQ